MKQPWRQWSWKQRATYSSVMFVVSVFLFVFGQAIDGLGILIFLPVMLAVTVPGLYVLVTAEAAAQRRFDAGDDSVYPPRVAAARRKREAGN